MPRYSDYWESFIKVLKLSNIVPEFSNSKLILINREFKPKLVLFKKGNKKFIINVGNFCNKSIKFYLLKSFLREKILNFVSRERKF